MSEPTGRGTDDQGPTEWPGRGLAAVFGDRRGLALFLGSLVFVGLFWRLRTFSTDQYAVLNALVSLADGHLAIHDAVYGSEVSPGTYVADGNLYGRNYGHVVVTLPVLFALRGLSLVFELRALLVGGWVLAFLGFAAVVGGLVDRRRLAVTVASPLALLVFLGNVLVGAPLPDRSLPLVALQLTTAVAAALLVVVLYRLVTRRYDARTGTAVGAVAILATPVGFWASIPKRHSVTALLVVCCLYALYRSRETGSVARATRYRALAYGTVGMTAWVHAGEALVLLVALAVVDLPTARRNRPRDLAVVGSVFALSMVPFLVTNTLVSGEPFTPPRMLPSADSVPPEAIETGGGGSGGGDAGATSTPTPSETGAAATSTPGPEETATSTPGGGPSGSPTDGTGIGSILAGLAAVFAPVASAVDQLVSYLQVGIDTVTESPDELRYTFVRSGYYPGLRASQDVAVNLSVLESMPLLGILVAAPLAVAVRMRAGLQARDGVSRQSLAAWVADRSVADTRNRLRTSTADIRDPLRTSPARTTEGFAVVFALLLTAVMMVRLPAHHMVTVRYLHPVYPLGLYLVVGLPAVRAVVAESARLLVGCYAGTVVVGTLGYVAFLALGDPVLGEAVQAFALVSLTTAVAVAVWASVATVRSPLAGRSHTRAGAILLGVAAGVVTSYLLVSGLALFTVERAFLLPWSEVVSDWIGFGASGV